MKYLITLLEKDPLFDKKDENSQLIEDIRDIIADKKLESQIDKVKTMTPEFKAMIVGVLEQILGYSSNSKMKK
ncbi:hypothetical protein [Paenibacillus donghaensis]|uniref:Uncharacterized protein n=1 Tax=Paenibacillus donghaensis TaxID=414771 RepID=A0A2Z2KHA2_9BACL|nr:hypothetical protein [Paenibacillus donghaensis]ASA22623.1 hypothetical protein B9T62_18625 [Paenibacillus donghaensis]